MCFFESIFIDKKNPKFIVTMNDVAAQRKELNNIIKTTDSQLTPFGLKDAIMNQENKVSKKKRKVQVSQDQAQAQVNLNSLDDDIKNGKGAKPNVSNK